MSLPAGTARFRRPSPAMAAGALGGLVVLSAAALLPLFLLSHEHTDVVTPLVIGLPAGAVGWLVARRQPRNPVGWLLLASTACLLLGTDGGLYALLDYRLGHSLPLGPVGLVLYQFWGPGISLLGLVILLFPDGRLPSAWWRLLWAYVAINAFSVVALGVATAGALMAHPVRVNADGGLVATDNPSGWYGAIQSVTLLLAGLLSLCFVGRQVLIWGRSSCLVSV
jgi:hypothetical protein